MSALPVNDWSVPATLTVAAADEADATTAVTAALAAIATALTALANGTEFNVYKAHAEDPDGDETEVGTGTYAFDYGDEVNGGFYLDAQLLVGEVSEAQAQQAAEAASAAINTAIAGLTPVTTVVLENTPDGYVFNLLQ